MHVFAMRLQLAVCVRVCTLCVAVGPTTSTRHHASHPSCDVDGCATNGAHAHVRTAGPAAGHCRTALISLCMSLGNATMYVGSRSVMGVLLGCK